MATRINQLKGLIIGCGSIGQRHLHNLKNFGIKNLAIYDYDIKKTNALSNQYKVQSFSNLDTALNFLPDFTLICTFPNTHVELSNLVMDKNSHIFIEKPISSNLKGVEKMLHKASKKKLKVGVGYNLRYDKGLNLIRNKMKLKEAPFSIFSEWGHNLKNWRTGLDYKNHYVLKKGGGIILDDSHEYDYARWLLDDKVESVYCQSRKINSLKTETESFASIILRFKKGTIGNFVLDHIRPQYERNCKIIWENNEMKWEMQPQLNKKGDYSSTAKIKITSINSSRTSKKIIKTKMNQMYIDEIKNFLESVYQNKKPKVDGWDGLESLRIGLAAIRSSEEGKIIHV